MTESKLMREEMTRVFNSLSVAGVMTKDKIDSRMRETVADLVSFRYVLKFEPIEAAIKSRGDWVEHENVEKITDLLTGMDTNRQMQLMKDKRDLDRGRPVRIINYVQKLIDIFPPAYLTHLLRSCLTLRAADTIRLYEFNKGEAQSCDYTNEPKEIDLTSTYGFPTLIP